MPPIAITYCSRLPELFKLKNNHFHKVYLVIVKAFSTQVVISLQCHYKDPKIKFKTMLRTLLISNYSAHPLMPKNFDCLHFFIHELVDCDGAPNNNNNNIISSTFKNLNSKRKP